jgi:hypothetical protein
MGRSGFWHQARCPLASSGVEVIEILDFSHAGEHLAQAATAVSGGQSEVGTRWLDKQCHALRHEGVTPVLAALDALQPRDVAGEDVVRTVRASVEEHTARMDYPAFRARLFPLGSWAIGRTVKNVLQQRQVLAGMRWTHKGAHCVANLRAVQRSVGRWDAFWRRSPCADSARCLPLPPWLKVPWTRQRPRLCRFNPQGSGRHPPVTVPACGHTPHPSPVARR